MTKKIFIIAGEESGDLLGARLINAIKKQDSDTQFYGVAGQKMINNGMDSIFPMEELSIMGIAEILPKIPAMLRRIKQTVDEIERVKPDILITIDSPDFCFRVIKKLKKNNSNIPAVHYVAPTVWAWRPKRAKKVAKFLDHLLALFPFEPPYFKKEGLDCSFVGHSIIETDIANSKGQDFIDKYKLQDKKIITILPGSRRGEILKHLPIFLETFDKISADHRDLQLVIPTLPHLKDFISGLLQSQLKPESQGKKPLKRRGELLSALIIDDDADKYNCFNASKIALAASGTVALELAMTKTPTIISYKMNFITSILGKILVKLKYVSLVNIILDKPVMPELLLEKCNSDLLSAEISNLLNDKEKQQAQIIEYNKAIKKLTPNNGINPSDRAAEVILGLIRR